MKLNFKPFLFWAAMFMIAFMISKNNIHGTEAFSALAALILLLA